MTDASNYPPIPDGDVTRSLTHVEPDGNVPHISLAGNTYTILVAGKDTDGRYCLIDMYVPSGGGPPPHRHDFEEMFTVLQGAIEVTFRGEKAIARAGESINVPANAPHSFRNIADEPARLLCMCTPAGQEEYFQEIAVPVASRTAPPPPLSEAEQAESRAKALRLALKYRSEFVKP